MKNSITALILGFSLITTSQANCLEAYNAPEITAYAAKKTKRKRHGIFAAKAAFAASIPVASTILLHRMTGDASGLLLTFLFVLPLEGGLLASTEFFETSALSSLEQAIVTVNWADSDEQIPPTSVRSLVSSYTTALMKNDLAVYSSSIADRSAGVRKVMIQQWLAAHQNTYVSEAIQTIKKQLVSLSESQILCSKDIPLNMMQIKRIIEQKVHFVE